SLPINQSKLLIWMSRRSGISKGSAILANEMRPVGEMTLCFDVVVREAAKSGPSEGTRAVLLHAERPVSSTRVIGLLGANHHDSPSTPFAQPSEGTAELGRQVVPPRSAPARRTVPPEARWWNRRRSIDGQAYSPRGLRQAPAAT